jgi:hypothetical protein
MRARITQALAWPGLAWPGLKRPDPENISKNQRFSDFGNLGKSGK